MKQEKLYKAMQDDLMDRESSCQLYRMSDYWTMVTCKYQAFIMPECDPEIGVDHDLVGNSWTADSHIHKRIDSTLNGLSVTCIGQMTVTVNLLKQKVLVMVDDFGVLHMIRNTRTANMLAKDKHTRCLMYQDLIVWWCPDDDFPIYAACVITGRSCSGWTN